MFGAAEGQRGAEIERVVHDVPWGEYMAETEELAGLYAFAERMPMRFAALDRTDDVDFAWEWLDWDGDDYRPGSPEPENEGEVDRTGL